MTKFKSELMIAPALLEGLGSEEKPLQRLYIAHFNDDGEPEFEQTVWSRKLNRDVFEIISPIWVTNGFKCGDIVGADCSYSFQELVWPDFTLEESDLTTLAIVPASTEITLEQIVNVLQSICGISGWICEMVERRLVIAVLPPELHQTHGVEIAEAFSGKALIRGPGPWCAKYLEAMASGDKEKAVAEFVRVDVEKDAEADTSELNLST